MLLRSLLHEDYGTDACAETLLCVLCVRQCLCVISALSAMSTVFPIPFICFIFPFRAYPWSFLVLLFVFTLEERFVENRNFY